MRVTQANSRADLACFGAAVHGGQSGQAGAVQRLAALKGGAATSYRPEGFRGFNP